MKNMLLLRDSGGYSGQQSWWWNRLAAGRRDAAMRGASPPRGLCAAGGDGSPAVGLGRGIGAAVPWTVAVGVLLLGLGVALAQGLAGRQSVWSSAARPGTASRRGLSSLPLTAQGVISGTLGADDGAYRVSASAGELRAANPAQHLRARFERSGVLIGSGRVRLGLSLRGVDYGGSLAALGEAAPRARANRVVYALGGLSEWYANGLLGLEQGFTLTRAPVGDAGGPLVLSLALSGNTRARVDAGGRGLTLTAPGGSSLHYDNLSATDARGRALHSWITLRGGRVLLHVDARGARYR